MRRFTSRRGAEGKRLPISLARSTKRPIGTEPAQFQAQLLQAQKMEAIGLLATGLAHDFNNTLMAAGGYADLIHAETASPQIRAYAEAIAEALERGTELTRHLLAFARPTDSPVRPVDVQAVVTGLLPLMRRVLGPRIEVEIVVEERQIIVHCEAGQLEQALMNLAINARDAMSVGGRLTIVVNAGRQTVGDAEPSGLSRASVFGDDVETGTVSAARPEAFVEIAVSDSGCGIPAEHIDRIFEPFFTTKPDGLGSGLGLPMVKRFAANAGGDVTVESARGVGTTVVIRLPMAESTPCHRSGWSGRSPSTPAAAHSGSRPTGPIADEARFLSVGQVSSRLG